MLIGFVASAGLANATERPAHYEKPEFSTAKDAVTASRNALLHIRSSLILGSYDEIHQTSYTLEAAAKTIGDLIGEDSDAAEAFVERVEIVHIASELEDRAILDAALPSLDRAMEAAVKALPRN